MAPRARRHGAFQASSRPPRAGAVRGLVFARAGPFLALMGENPRHHRLFIGTYTKRASQGIYTVELDRATGAFGRPELAAKAPNPTFLALSPDRRYLYAVCAGEGWASSFRVDPAAPGLVPVQQTPAGAGPTAKRPTSTAKRAGAKAKSEDASEEKSGSDEKSKSE